MQPLGLPPVAEVMGPGAVAAELQAGMAGHGAVVTGFWPVVWGRGGGSGTSVLGPKS